MLLIAYKGSIKPDMRFILGLGVLVGLLGLSCSSEPYAGYARIVGSSMEPVLSEGDVVFVYPTAFEEIEVGDVVVWYGIGGTMVAHRVVRRTERHLWTKGDAESQEDAYRIGRGSYMGELRLD